MSHEIRLSVPAPEGTTERYAAASGDHNPIHLDEAFARSVGLPGRILHGLWTAAQVARAATQAAPAGPLLDNGESGRPAYALAELSVQFRGMGQMGAPVTVSGSAEAGVDGTVSAKLEATQDGARLIRNGRARLRQA
ncbi:MAG TPA: MaoC/PaaZ C-terminal domain-containing protein [Solirubrobacteraceae bacterium]|nr:MaoC/PaaZ C-terminal domain-containing protein [Solirubrobacteraceae bacterium]